MDYYEVKFFNETFLNEPLIAWLGENDFDMFEEREDGVNAYIEEKKYRQEKIIEIIALIPDGEKNIRFESSLIKDQNWNKKWESNFEPVLIAGRVFVRAPFHSPGKEFQHEIIIEPKMSFGTGHHATTALMIGMMTENDLTNKSVLDMGCGTAILSILAEMLGASSILAIDIEEWAAANSAENCERNSCKVVTVKLGDAELINGKSFDIILANINRNILLNDMSAYATSLNDGGDIFFSGILTCDMEVIDAAAKQNNLSYISQSEQSNWIALHYKKN